MTYTSEDEARYTALHRNSAARESNAAKGLRNALMRRGKIAISDLTAAEIVAQMTDEQKRVIAAKLGLKATPAKSGKSDADRARAEGVAQGKAEVRAAIKAVLAAPESRGVERVVMTAIARGASAKGILADLRNVKARVGQTTTGKADDWGNIHAEVAEENGLVANMKARFGLDGDK